ncbi:alpha/beta hydrolase [Actinomadura hibisca]|uniref:alpha/beta hydrolase n=1 Tax=Actinomadura hibisca TaxID=68565 RepID=UPI00147208AD|nr:alpha/beta hydrolase family protein [Actinomadura hibisca]
MATIAPGGTGAAPAPAGDGAAVVGERRRSTRVLDLAVRSPNLPGVAHVRLLLPPGWSPDADRTWPVLWLLHGVCGQGHTAWTDNTDLERRTEGLDVLIVLPDGGCANYSDWWNRGAGGPPKWETFHLAELRQILERGYRAGTARAIAGSGLGGTGALAYAARHRGLFRAAASFSGTLDLLHRDPAALDGPDLVELSVAVGRPAADWRALWGDPCEQRVVWRHHNPYDLADRLAGVRLYLSGGDGTPGPYDPLPGRGPDAVEALACRTGQAFAAKLARLGIPAATHFYRGTHGWPYWERELNAALPVLLAEII